MRIRLTIAYDGAEFAGWQSQARGVTIQDTLESALAAVAKQPVRLHGSGRTDAGVHALGQVAHFDAPVALAPENWTRALNANLPPQVRVLRAARAKPDFHARFSAKGKIYRYRIFRGPVLPPHEFRRAWHVPQPMNPGVAREAAALFVGRHDFRPFSANRGTPVADTVRTLAALRLATTGPVWTLTFEGDGFLYKMARMLAGAIVRAALGKESLAAIRAPLAEPDSGKWSHVAPAGGLCLVRVLY